MTAPTAPPVADLPLYREISLDEPRVTSSPRFVGMATSTSTTWRTRRFTAATIRWKDCEYCFERFPDSRKNRLFCSAQCQESMRRRRQRKAAIIAAGGKCHDCGTKYDPDYGHFFILKDGTVVCGRDFSRRSREKFWQRWPKGKKGYESPKPPAKRLYRV
jgi:predicted nucleic acid-binding Zn ribbon protein